MTIDRTYEAIIVGAGPAGLTAGLYTSRAGLRTLVLEREVVGGELVNRDLIENYPGYPDGVLGPELGSNMMTQAMKHGTEIRLAEVRKIETDRRLRIVRTSVGDFGARAVVIASGSRTKRLNVPGEKELSDRGVFYCATCDGPRFTGKVVTVVGGGDSGITEALFLARMASRVIVIELLPRLTASRILQDRAHSNPRIEIRPGVKVEAIQGDGEVKAIACCDVRTGQKSILEVDGVLVRTGLEVNTGYLKGCLPLNDIGQVLVDEQMKATVAGVFAAGDVRHNSAMQVATAVGDGAAAALSLRKYLEGVGGSADSDES